MIDVNIAVIGELRPII